MTFQVHQVIDTEYCADVCVFHPDRSILVVGTYQLEDQQHPEENGAGTKKRDRLGRLYFYSVHVDEQGVQNEYDPNHPALSYALREFQRMEWPTGGILDIKWLPNLSVTSMEDSSLSQLCIADSMGNVTILRFNSKTSRFEITASIEIVEKTKLCLALDYSSTPSNTTLAVSTSDGGASVVDLETNTVMERIQAHTFETWCVHQTSPQTMYTGGDDSFWKLWDLRSPTSSRMVMKGSHTAGVTSVVSTHPWTLLSGSYDQKVHGWDPRHVRHPLHTLDTAGGVWRIKYHPPYDLAMAVMHGGCQLVKWDPHASSKPQGPFKEDSMLTYTRHQSMVYGVDWLDDTTLATCSFYDHQLHVWSIVRNGSC